MYATQCFLPCRGQPSDIVAQCHPLVKLTQVFANVLNLKDRSTPCPLAVSAHFLAVRPSSAVVRSCVSDPSANLACAADMAAVLEYDRAVNAVDLSC